ncbi:MAG: hypothetical protein WAN46_21600, partial [Gammaproteobacteria bacterium]
LAYASKRKTIIDGENLAIKYRAPAHSHTRRDRALRVSPGSLTAARTRSTIAPVNVRPNSCMGRTIRPIGNSVQCVH